MPVASNRDKERLNLSKVKEINRIDLMAKRLVEGFITGMHKSPYHGFSVEFSEHRLYNTGESTRHIDWKVFARTDKLFIKNYEEETNLRCTILLDCSGSMHYPKGQNTKLRFSIYSTAALSYLLQKQRDAVGITTFAEQVEEQTNVKSSSVHLHKLFIFLEDLLNNAPKNKTTALPEAIHHISSQIHKRSLVIIFSDMFDNSHDDQTIFNALRHLIYNKHEVLLFHVTDKATEMEFEFDNRPYTFVDLETSEKVKLNPQNLQKSYQNTMRKYYNDLKVKCGQYKIDFVEADISEPFDKILMSYLIKRAKMR